MIFLNDIDINFFFLQMKSQNILVFSRFSILILLCNVCGALFFASAQSTALSYSAENGISPKLSSITSNNVFTDNYSPLDFLEPNITSNPINIQSLAPSISSSWKGKKVKDFEGLGYDGYFPADPSGAIGIDHYVSTINVMLGIFDRSGNNLYQKPTNTLFQNFGTNCDTATPSPGCACQVNNNGDAIVLYDKAAQRFLVTQFSITNPDVYGYYYCVAISKTSNPLGSWYQYAFKTNNFFDYPKIVHWNDIYAVTANLFSSSLNFLNPQVCILERSQMLLGNTAGFLCYDFTPSQYGITPGENEAIQIDSINKPLKLINIPLFTISSSVLITELTYTTSPSLAIVAITTQNVIVTTYTIACNTNGNPCISQPEISQKLDNFPVFPMYRLVYRQDPKTLIEYLAFTHNVEVSPNQQAVSWNILSRAFGTPLFNLFKSGIQNPDTTNDRWLGSLALDSAFNLGIGYSLSSSTSYPSIYVSGRLFTDPDGQLMEEQLAMAGSAPQVLSRWGDYSHMTVDPVDDCTFLYINMYERSINVWRTHVYSFNFPTCTGSSIVGDPQFTGFLGQSYQIHGLPDTIFNIISSPLIQLNSRFDYISKSPSKSTSKIICKVIQTICWTHPGTYLGQIDIKVGKDKILLTAGLISDGFNSIKLNQEEINIGQKYIIGYQNYTRQFMIKNDNHHLILYLNQFTLTIINSDMFFNYKILMTEFGWKTMNLYKIHGLLGQTWSNITYKGKFKYIVGEPLDYVVSDKFKDDFMYNQWVD
jgi:hypothetical protein